MSASINRRHRFSRQSLPLLLLLAPLYAGCSEHRITLDEFLAIQQAHKAAEAAAQKPATNQPAIAAIAKDLGPYRLGPGDTLSIRHFGAGDEAATLTGIQVRVDRDGNIELPVAGKLKVEGLDLVEADRAVQAALVPSVFRDVVVHVSLIEPEATRVLVTGAVITPGLIGLRHSERNPIFAMVSAGGWTQSASGSVSIKRLRDSSKEEKLNLLDPEQFKEALAMAPLENGDIVTVEAATPNTVYVGGLVVASHPQSYPPGTEVNVLQAFAAAGGLRTDVFPTEATLIRRVDGKDMQVKLDVERITKGLDPNITLAAGDVLWVPDTLATRIEDWCNKNLFIRAGASATYSLDYSMPGIDYLNKAAQSANTGSLSNSNQSNFSPFNNLIQNQALNSIGNSLP